MEMAMKTKLNASERAIERASASYRPVATKDRKRIEAILGRSRKSRNINIRIAEPTLAEIRKRAEQEGLPYQTLISSILHKYVMNRLVDEDAVKRSLRFLRSAD
jgi:predicted DNA binding CopG/RHH family protein